MSKSFRSYPLLFFIFVVTLSFDALFVSGKVPIFSILLCGIVLLHEFVAPYIKK